LCNQSAPDRRCLADFQTGIAAMTADERCNRFDLFAIVLDFLHIANESSFMGRGGSSLGVKGVGGPAVQTRGASDA
jgi:hypothetical protein